MKLKVAAISCLILAFIVARPSNTVEPEKPNQRKRHDLPVPSNQPVYSQTGRNSVKPTMVRSNDIGSPTNQENQSFSSRQPNRQPTVEGERATHPSTPRIGKKSLAEAPPHETSEHFLPAVKLAETVRLPAAIMATGTGGDPIQATPPPTVEQAKDEIGTNYYRDLAAHVAAGTIPALIDTSAGGETSLIETGAETERIRNVADQLFRSLFGDAAYNSQTMNSLIESRLPAIAE